MVVQMLVHALGPLFGRELAEEGVSAIRNHLRRVHLAQQALAVRCQRLRAVLDFISRRGIIEPLHRARYTMARRQAVH